MVTHQIDGDRLSKVGMGRRSNGLQGQGGYQEFAGVRRWIDYQTVT